MSDFLSSLLVRNISMAPGDEAPREEVLHPRPRSRFEQPAPGGLTDAADGSQGDGLPGAISLPPRPPAAAPGISNWEAGERRASGDRRDELRAMDGPHSLTPPGEPRGPLPPPRPAGSFETQRSPRETLTAPQPKANPSEQPGRAEETAEESRPQISERPPVHRGRLDAPVELASPRVRQERADVGHAGPGEPGEPGRAAPLTPVNIAPQAPSRQGLPVPTQRPPEQVDQPVIHISIGRVEVRAVQASTAPPQNQARKPSPVMTLEEYLRRRSGGER